MTEFGQAALETAEELADAMAMARSRLAAARGMLSGELRLGVADIFLTNPEARIAETLSAFLRRAPAVQIHVSRDAPSRLGQALLGRKLHAVITCVEANDTRREATPLFEKGVRLYVATRPGAPPPHLRDLRGLGYGAVLRCAERSPAGAAVARLRLPHQVNASGLEAVATSIATGRYVGLLPTHLPRGLASGQRFAEVAGAEAFALRIAFMLLTERARPAGAVIRALREAALEAHRR